MIRRFSSVFIILLCLLTLPVSAAAEQYAVGTLDRAPTSMQNETPFYKQCQLGSVVADAVREYCGADIALIPTGVLLNDLSTGDISLEQVERVFSEDQSLAIAQLTAAQLWALLNHAVSLIAVDYDTERIDETGSEYAGFLQISGITMTYDASAPAESRVTKLTLSDGTELSSENSSAVFCVAGTVELFYGAYVQPTAED